MQDVNFLDPILQKKKKRMKSLIKKNYTDWQFPQKERIQKHNTNLCLGVISKS